MESPLESYKYLSKFDGIVKIANDVLFEKYIIQNRAGANKLTYIEDTDQESVIRRLNGGFPVPGFVYTFIYKPSQDEINVVRSGRGLERYVDHVPLVFCTGTDKLSFSGINLNVIPPLERLKFLQMFYESFESFFKHVEVSTQNGVLALNKKFLDVVNDQRGSDMIRDWSMATESAFSYGYRKYSTKKVDRLRMVEIAEWQYIPFFSSTDAVKMLNIARVQSLYWKNK